MTPELIKVVEQAYDVFGKYQAQKPLDACPCCLSLEQEDLLVKLPLKNIGCDLLADYNNSAKPEYLNADEFKYFLPRFLDLISKFEFASHSLEINLNRMAYFSEDNWNPQEKKIIQDFSEHFFSYCLVTYPLPACISLDSILVMFYIAHISIDTFLEKWSQSNTKEALFHFSDFIQFEVTHTKDFKYINAFADEALKNILSSWIKLETSKPYVLKKLRMIEQLILEDTNLDDATLTNLNTTYDIIDCMSR